MFDFLEAYGFRVDKFEINYLPLAYPTKTDIQVKDGYRLILTDVENRGLLYSRVKAILEESGLVLESLEIDEDWVNAYLSIPKEAPVKPKRKSSVKNVVKSEVRRLK